MGGSLLSLLSLGIPEEQSGSDLHHFKPRPGLIKIAMRAVCIANETTQALTASEVTHT
jgi:hypothetical protein